MKAPDSLVRPNILAMAPYSSARGTYTGTQGIFLDANESPLGLYNRYPDPLQIQLKKRISEIKGVPVNSIFLGNGSDEVIDIILRIFCEPEKDAIWIFEPTYGMYEVSACINNVKVYKSQLDPAFDIDTTQIGSRLADPELKVVFICSPNNPTGNVMNVKAVEWILQNFDGIVVVDEAYIDFTTAPSLLCVLKDYKNLIVMQTLSKAWGLAGLRIGMAFAHPGILQYFNKIKPPYNISTANQQLALERLKDVDGFRSAIKEIRQRKAKMQNALERCPLVKDVFPSEANFLLFRVEDAGFVYQKLITKNIITRLRDSQVPDTIRVTIGTEAENAQFIKALNELI